MTSTLQLYSFWQLAADCLIRASFVVCGVLHGRRYKGRPKQQATLRYQLQITLFAAGICSSGVQALELTSLPAADMMSQRITGPLCSQTKPLSLQGYIPMGGIEQWVTIRTANCRFPVILFLHGGPANPLTPFADTLYAGWEQQFTLVQWDQRASGRTWLRNKPAPGEHLTLELMTADGLALVHFLRQQLQRPIILMGSSWGSVLGVRMVQQQPDAFAAYVGSSQLVSGHQNTLASYQALIKQALASKDEENIRLLQDMGPPPYNKPNGKLRRISRAYEAQRAEPAPSSWWIPAPAYQLEIFAPEYEAAEDYSFAEFMGFDPNTGTIHKGMYHAIELQQEATTFQVPVYLIQGAADLVTVPDITQTYFDRIVAPHKELVTVPGAGHTPNVASLAAEWRVLMHIRAQLPADRTPKTP